VLVLEEAGYQIKRIAGTSAGAIAASLIAALVQHGDPMATLKKDLDTLQFKKFMPEGRLRRFIELVGRRPGAYLADVAILTTRMASTRARISSSGSVRFSRASGCTHSAT